MCNISGKSPLSSHKTTLKQHINGQKRWKMKEKDLSGLGLVFMKENAGQLNKGWFTMAVSRGTISLKHSNSKDVAIGFGTHV